MGAAERTHARLQRLQRGPSGNMSASSLLRSRHWRRSPQQTQDYENAPGSWSIEEAEAALMESLRQEPVPLGRHSTLQSRFSRWNQVRRYAVAAVILATCSFAGYRIGYSTRDIERMRPYAGWLTRAEFPVSPRSLCRRQPFQLRQKGPSGR